MTGTGKLFQSFRRNRKKGFCHGSRFYDWTWSFEKLRHGYERCQSQVDASEEEISKMSDIVTEAIESGALGFSTSRTILHRDVHGVYVPGTEASSEEMKSLAFAIDKAGEGTLEIVSDWLDKEIEMSWMREYVEKSDCGLTVFRQVEMQ